MDTNCQMPTQICIDIGSSQVISSQIKQIQIEQQHNSIKNIQNLQQMEHKQIEQPIPIISETNLKPQNDHIKLKEQYYKFFKENNIIPNSQNYIPRLPSDEQFKKHKIKYLKGNQFHQGLHSYDETYIRIKNTQRQATIVNYIVIIGMFELEITLLNINKDADIQKNKIGSGSFGSVRIQSQNKRMFAVKRQIFKEKYQLNEFNMMANKYEIDQAISQLAIYKICSLLKIGPAAETQIGFDLICYRDCIQFQIQYCLKIEYGSRDEKIIYVDERRFEKQIKQCLLVLHFYGIIHKDIKPANILFSVKYNKYVFTDFGISHPVVEKIGYRSETHCQGTLLYMSKQMRQIKKDKTGYVHLYGNDVRSLQLSLMKRQIIQQNIEQGLKQFNQNLIKIQNAEYEYQYLKLKYYCIKLDSKMNEVQNYWVYMNEKRREQLISIVDRSIEYDKIKSVYNYLCKLQQFKKWNLESLRIQAQSIKNIKIDLNKQQINELHLKNILRVNGYGQQVKDMIIKLKQQQKYKSILKIIDKMIDKNSEINYRDRMFGNHVNYIKKIKKEIEKCQQKKDQEGIFKGYMIILQYGNKQEKIKTIQKLIMLNYERKKEEKVEEMIRVYNIEKNKERLIQFVQLMKKENEEIDKIITKMRLENIVSEIYNYVGDYKKELQYLTKSVTMNISFYGQQHPSVADTYNNIAVVYESIGKYEKALQYYTKSVTMNILFYGQQHPSVADTYNNIAVVYESMGKYEKALQYYTKSVTMNILFYGQQHPSVADTYNNIAVVYESIGKYEKALQYYTKSVTMKISFYGQQHPSVADTYHNIAYVYESIGKYEKALQYYTKSVTMKISFYGQQHPSVADTYNNIAVVYESMGKYEKALQYYTKSVTMKISFYGQQHPSVADTYNNIAVVYESMGQYEKALQYYTKSVTMKISFYGQQHPSVADTYNNIAGVYKTMGKYEKALQYYTKSVTMKISFYGQQHPSVAATYNNIAVVYESIGKYEKALQYYTKSVTMKISFCGQQHPSVADTYNNIAGVYKTMGKYEKALQYYTKSVTMKISFYGQQHPSVAATYNNIAVVYESMGKYEKALQYYTKSVTMKISFYGQQHPSVAATYNNIAVVYESIGKYEKALQYYTKSVTMKISFCGQQHPSVADTYNNIAGVYKTMGKYEKALQYYTKSVTMKISFYGQQHPSVADTFYNISSTFFLLPQLTQSLKYCNKSIRIRSNLSLMQYPQVALNYHLLSCIFQKKQKYIKSLNYEYSALDTFLKTSHFDNHKSPYYLQLLANIYYKMNRFIQSYFFYRMSCQISVKYFPIHDINLRNSKHMMNEMEWSMPSLIQNYNTNIQFMNEISNKYSQLPNYKLMKLLSGKKWQLKFELEHRGRRDRFQYLKCMIEIYLCYKYLGYPMQMKKAREQTKVELMRYEQSQQKSMFQEFLQEI